MAVLTVTNTNDAGAGSLRDTIAGAIDNDTIEFDAAVVATGVITLTSGHIDIAVGININGPGSDQLAIFSTGARVFLCSAGITYINGLTLGQSTSNDGGILRNETTIYLTDIVFASGASDYGGAINNISTITLTDCTIQSCVSEFDGGGFYNGGTAYITNLNITGCQTTDGDGAGFYNAFGATVTWVNGSCNENTAKWSGGGIFNSGTTYLYQLTIDSNSATDGDGDGIAEYLGTGNITRCTVSNHVDGITANLCSVFIDNSTISGNSGYGVRGVSVSASVDIKHSTITKNGTGISAAVISGLNVFTLINNIIAGNTTVDVDMETGECQSFGYNLFGTSTNPITTTTGDQTGLTFDDLAIGLLADNGGPTFTHALTPTSPALDAGFNGAAPLTDQRGSPRIVNTTIDIGAYEYVATRVCVAAGTYSRRINNPTLEQIAVIKAQLNAQALAEATELAMGAGCTPSVGCPESPFADIEISGSVTSGGHVDHTFFAAAGTSFSAWVKSAAGPMWPQTTLYNPSMGVLDQDTNRVFSPSSYHGSLVTGITTETGMQTLRVEADDGVSIGDYTGIIRGGVEITTENIINCRISCYVPSTKRLFVLSGYAADEAIAYCINAETFALVNAVVLQIRVGPAADIGLNTCFYNSNDNRVWVETRDRDDVNKFHFFKLDPLSGAMVFDSGPISSHTTNYMGFVPSVNRFYGIDGTDLSNAKGFNCSTLTYDVSLALGTTIDSQSGSRYIPEIDRVLVVDIASTNYWLINPNDNTIDGPKTGDINIMGYFRASDGLYYTAKNSSPKKIVAVDLSTGTTMKSFADGYTKQWMNYDEARGRLFVMQSEFGSQPYYVAEYDIDTLEPLTAVKWYTGPSSSLSGWSYATWCGDACRMAFHIGDTNKVYVVS